MRSIALALTAALIAAALAAPQALAMPDKGPIRRADSDATYQGGFYMPHVGGSDRSDAEQRGLRPLPGPPTWPASPTPIESVTTEPVPSDDGSGLPWDTIVVGLAGAGLVLGCAGTVVGMRRRSHRPRVAA
jgi:hypothetical protein